MGTWGAPLGLGSARRSRMRTCRAALAIVSLSIAACGRPDDSASAVEVGTTSSRLVLARDAAWPNPSAIPVCWVTAGFDAEKEWIKTAIAASWEAAAPHVHFVGW